jgi:hypothetical protein
VTRCRGAQHRVHLADRQLDVTKTELADLDRAAHALLAAARAHVASLSDR